MRTLRKIDIEAMERELQVLNLKEKEVIRGGGLDGYQGFYTNGNYIGGGPNGTSGVGVGQGDCLFIEPII
jgi:hypothetical protein